MQQNNPAQKFFTDLQTSMQSMMGAIPASPFDVRGALEAQRKNMQALADANQRAMMGWQALAQRQAEMLSQFVQDNSGLARETMAEGTPQDKLARQTELLKNACERSILNSQELAEMMRKCSAETAEVINNRVLASLSEINSQARTS